ncbi:outer membrane beta-barrel protein [Pontibacter qinzhouensis]|uniref:Outer membrane beta-barrel protein n=1 Tax=Pontibacter qinzhouensis TaxID=2603253 RepID=A0A5C8KFS8_9BACT|nr:outer membrane beta-barrel protein [Pontibacter qinzhouensis]TXK52423.1 outer membrane beta-barrel protein [Pontibacter qinzhouensis]
MNIKFYLSVLLLLAIGFVPLYSFGQSGYYKKRGVSNAPERGFVVQVGGGVTAIKSDICGSWGCNDLGPNVSIGTLYKINPTLGISGEVDYFRLGAEEKDPARPLNVAFQSEVIEVSGMVVLNLLDSYSGSGNYRSSHKRFVVPFVKGGAGFIYYTPSSFPANSRLNDSQVTYDNERKYPAFAPVFSFGGGLRFRLNDEFSIAPELVYHITTTDYLDNIGPRLGNAGNTDHYGLAAIKLLYTPFLKNNIFSKKNYEGR